MPTFDLAFVSYNPFTDERLDPLSGDQFYRYPDVPIGLSNTIASAKKLLPSNSLEDIENRRKRLFYLIDKGQMVALKHWDSITDRTYHYSDEAESLLALFNYGKPEIAQEEWPAYMGTLALALSGEIYNLLWPSEEVRREEMDESLFPGKIPHRTPESKKELMYSLAYVAVKAVSFGLALEMELKSRQKAQENARRSHQRKHKLAQNFISWVFGKMPAQLRQGYAPAAAQEFRDNVLDEQDKKVAGTGNFNNFLVQRLKKHCRETGTPYPFKRKN